MKKNLLETIFKGVAFAMGVNVIVLNTLGVLTAATGTTLLSIGMTALAPAAMMGAQYFGEPQNR